jgi:hypothetical protein
MRQPGTAGDLWPCCAVLFACALWMPGAARAAQPARGAASERATTKTAPARAAGKPGAPAKPASPASAARAVPLAVNIPPTAAIDQLVARKWREAKITPARPCDDASFARRIYLDLAGRIPTPAELDRFAADGSTEKRAALVDRLLASPEYAEHMRDVFDVVFMGRAGASPAPRRRRGKAAPAESMRREWLDYLERGFAENRPWDRTARDLVLARPAGAADRGSIWFLYGRGDRYQEIAEAVSSSLLGVQVQCAQCHNHFMAPEIQQKDYWGLVAFFNRSKNMDTAGGPSVSEAAIGGFSNYATLAGKSFPAELTFFGANVPEMRPAPNVTEQDLPTLYQPAPGDAPDGAVGTPSAMAHPARRVCRSSPAASSLRTGCCGGTRGWRARP